MEGGQPIYTWKETQASALQNIKVSGKHRHIIRQYKPKYIESILFIATVKEHIRIFASFFFFAFLCGWKLLLF